MRRTLKIRMMKSVSEIGRMGSVSQLSTASTYSQFGRQTNSFRTYVATGPPQIMHTTGSEPARVSACIRRIRDMGLRQQATYDVAVHVGQAIIATGVAEGQFLVIEAQGMQDRRLQVVDVDRGLDHVEAKFVGCTIGHARSDASAREPHRVGLRVMVSAQAAAQGRVRFHHWRAAELAPPDDQRIVEQ